MRINAFCRSAVIALFVTPALVSGEHFIVSAAAQAKSSQSQIQPFLGTWTAVHAGTPIIVLHLRSEKGELAGDVRVCSYTINTETSGTVDVVTDATLSQKSPIKNIKVSADSMSFDWTDPDGDTDHWKLQLTTKAAGKIVWVGLPAGVKVLPIPVTKT